MWENKQKTLSKSINFEGTGLHSGKKVCMKLEPAEANIGIIFKRIDIKKNNEIKANYKNVSSAKLCTKIENNHGVSISTVEHLMAALYICGVDNLIVALDGAEVPIMDGSAIEFVEKIKNVGLKTLGQNRKFIKINKKVELKLHDKSISIEPSKDSLKVAFTLSYENNPLIRSQTNCVDFKNKNLENIYSARTFCLYEDIEKVKSLGLAKGGNLDNAVVIKGDKVLNEKGLRSKNEFVNHKILDLAGDFMLAGMRVIGTVSCMHGGHLLTNDFLRKMLSDESNFTVVESVENISNLKEITPNQKRIAVNA
tara:strand:- start:2235 stop:3164 length:930 start_codon:yes stop_codon:yes gene_type:complete